MLKCKLSWSTPWEFSDGWLWYRDNVLEKKERATEIEKANYENNFIIFKGKDV